MLDFDRPCSLPTVVLINPVVSDPRPFIASCEGEEGTAVCVVVVVHKEIDIQELASQNDLKLRVLRESAAELAGGLLVSACFASSCWWMVLLAAAAAGGVFLVVAFFPEWNDDVVCDMFVRAARRTDSYSATEYMKNYQ